MSEKLAERFIAALQQIESGGEVDDMASLFADECEIGNVTLSETLHGRDGVKEFWTHYRETLGEVRSTFKNKVIGDKTIALEWNTTGKSRNQEEVDYNGVSVIETEGDKIRRFFAYYNPAKLGSQLSHTANQ